MAMVVMVVYGGNTPCIVVASSILSLSPRRDTGSILS